MIWQFIVTSGAAHIHGVLFLDLKKIEMDEIEKGNFSFTHLNSALETIANDNVPNAIEKQSITDFIDKFISCSLQHPMTVSYTHLTLPTILRV